MFELLSFFGFGLLLSMSPCMLPMLPIMAAILVGNDKPIRGKRALVLASAFTLSSALCYAIFGAFSGLIGVYIQTTLQIPLIILPVSVLLVGLALVQLGIFNLPINTNSILNKVGFKRNSIVGASLLGILSVLTMSPCVTPVLAGVLVYIGTTHDVFLGGLRLFIMGLGAGMPLLILSSIGANFLPKPGKWMNIIKYLSASALIVMAVCMSINALSAAAIADIHIQNRLIPVTKSVVNKQQKILIFVTSPTCTYCKSIEDAIQKGVAEGWAVQKVRRYPGVFGAPNLIKIVNKHETGRLEGGPRTFEEIKAFLNE